MSTGIKSVDALDEIKELILSCLETIKRLNPDKELLEKVERNTSEVLPKVEELKDRLYDLFTIEYAYEREHGTDW